LAKKKEKMKKTTKMILAIELVFVIGVMIYLAASKPQTIAPVSGYVINDNNFDFKFENAKKIIISTDQEFKNKIEFSSDSAIKLPPGTYYWKARGWIRESETENFTLASLVSLRLDEEGRTLAIYNQGNREIKITVIDGKELFNKTIEEESYATHEAENEEIIIEGEEK
jgi:hypothetical protein